jgi:hypothetical protein
MCPTEANNEDTTMRDSTRTDMGQRKKTEVKFYREKMQTREVVGKVPHQKLVKSN